MSEIDDLGAAARLASLPIDIRTPAERALDAWRRGDLDAAKTACDEAFAVAEASESEFGAFHALHLRACVAFSERDYALARVLHNAVLTRCAAMDFLGGMGSSLCDLAMIDLAEGDVDSALVHYERGVACYEDGGYLEQAAAARALWDGAAQPS